MEKSVREYLEGMDPERALYIQKIAYMVKEEALQDARASSQRYFLHGMIAGIIISSLTFAILYYGWLK